VDQALDAVFQSRERAERGKLGDRRVDKLAQLVAPADRGPRLFLRALDRQGNTLAVVVDFDKIYHGHLSHAQYIGWVIVTAPP
jgi:hypothetical protein